ncbi:integrase arm-type DNA-binding domain-containing protein [Bradyrhizobium liaoningense]
MAKRKALRDIEQSVFTEANIAAMAKDMKSGRILLDRTVLSDDLVTGLRVVIRKDGTVAYHASYHFGDDRPFMKLGVIDPKDPDYISLNDARELTKVIKTLAAKGINPQEGLHRRLVAELLRDGVNWKPERISRKK